ncbi:MAG: hypothetical protein V4608_06865 [Bacteroidota bacterium]
MSTQLQFAMLQSVICPVYLFDNQLAFLDKNIQLLEDIGMN